jgi:hypothetical protein
MGSASQDCWYSDGGHYHYGYYHDDYYGHTNCVTSNDGLLIGGIVTGIVGTSLIIGGALLYATGRTHWVHTQTWSAVPATSSSKSPELRFHF